MNEIVKTEKEETAFMSMIERVAMSPDADVSKLEKMLEMQERIVAKQAEQSFNEAMSRLDFPHIPKLGTIKMSGTAKASGKAYTMETAHARYEDVDKIIRPIYRKEGFTVSFNVRFENGAEVYKATLAHVAGHSIFAEMVLPADNSGSKNGLQAKGSSITYAKRYLVSMLFNLVFVDEDDDGVSGGTNTISAKQSAELKQLVKDSGADVKGFLHMYGVNSVDELPAANYSGAKSILEAKKKQKERKNAGA